jgi:thioredoxin 2
MSETIADRPPEAASGTLVVACPVDASLNRVPRAKLDRGPKCGTCHNPLFQGKAVELNAANFEKHALKSDLPVVIDFWAEWCGPCRMMTPNFEAAAALLEPRVRLGKLDTEAEAAIAGRYGIRGIPSMIMIRKGREIARTSGAMPTSAIVAWVEQGLKSA